MANVKVKITFMSFQIQDNQTIATIEFESDAGAADEGAPWDGGKRMKTFPPEISVIDIIKKEIATDEYMVSWERVG